jgi:hypothetical protein
MFKSSTENFLRLIRQQAEAPTAPPNVQSPPTLQALKAAPAVAETPVVGTGSDTGQFETVIPPTDARALAAAIIAAGKARVSGHTLSTKLLPLADAIVAAGERRRGNSDR